MYVLSNVYILSLLSTSFPIEQPYSLQRTSALFFRTATARRRRVRQAKAVRLIPSVCTTECQVDGKCIAVPSFGQRQLSRTILARSSLHVVDRHPLVLVVHQRHGHIRRLRIPRSAIVCPGKSHFSTFRRSFCHISGPLPVTAFFSR